MFPWPGLTLTRIGLEAEPLSQWLCSGMRDARLTVEFAQKMTNGKFEHTLSEAFPMRRVLQVGGILSDTVANIIESSHSVNTLRQEGDRARDRKDWIAATKYYTNFLNKRPKDSAIWVQLGHALKEQGLHADAEAAYRKALALSPQDADGFLQLGHVLKLQGVRARPSKPIRGLWSLFRPRLLMLN